VFHEINSEASPNALSYSSHSQSLDLEKKEMILVMDFQKGRNWMWNIFSGAGVLGGSKRSSSEPEPDHGDKNGITRVMDYRLFL
jgi:hypothetical protein